MTASARLHNRPAAGREKIVPIVRTVPAAALTRHRPAPPAPVVPLTPPVGVVEAAPQRSGQLTRLVAAAIVTLTVVAGLAWIGHGTSPGIPAPTTVVQVGAGETEWDVARRVAPHYDQRAVVERIRQLNGLVGSAVQPGQQLQVPDGR
jgi:hypothetical protein